jgi:subtilisin family serine protease
MRVSIIAAVADNGAGIYGVAPEAALVAVRACHPTRTGSIDGVCTVFALGRAFNFAVLNGARVVNVSLAGPADALIPRLLAAADARGVVVVAAAGNAGPTAPPPYPAAIETAVAVTAVDARSSLDTSAVHGSFVKVAAPGVDVLTTAPGNQYTARTGTSLAAAHVSGVVALMLQAKPDLTPAAIRRLLESTSRPLGAAAPNPQFGHGLVDACRAVAGALGGQRNC